MKRDLTDLLPPVWFRMALIAAIITVSSILIGFSCEREEAFQSRRENTDRAKKNYYVLGYMQGTYDVLEECVQFLPDSTLRRLANGNHIEMVAHTLAEEEVK